MHWNRKIIIDSLRELNKGLGHHPSVRKTKPTLYQACCRYFGSFNKAKIAAGFNVNYKKHHILKTGSEILKENLAYVIGTVEGDGYCRIRKSSERSSGEIILKVINKDFAEEFANQLKKWSGIKPTFSKKGKEYFVALSSIDAARIIKGINIEELANSHCKKVKTSFLKGLYDSEGGVVGTNLNRRRIACRWIHFSNSDEKIIKATSKVLDDFGIKYKIRSRVHSGFGSKKLQYELLIFGLENFKRFLKNIGFSIGYKNDKLKEIISSYGQH